MIPETMRAMVLEAPGGALRVVRSVANLTRRDGRIGGAAVLAVP